MGYPADAHRRDPARAAPCRCSCPPGHRRRSRRPTIAHRVEPRLARGRHAAGRRRRRSTSPTPTTYNNATSLTVYDAKGQDVALTYYFQKAATDTWNVYVTANGTHDRRHRRRRPDCR